MNEKTYEEYRNAFSEIDYIISNSESNVRDKIPNSFKKLVKQNKSEEYIVNIDLSKSLAENKLLPKTKNLIYLIYRDFLCTDAQRKKFLEDEKIRFRELEDKYNIDNIFRRKAYKEQREELLPVEIGNDRWYRKILKKIKSIFLK